MKTADELFRPKCHKHYYKETAVINLKKFTEALEEHDKEIVEMIDDMINKDDEIYALTELKNKIK